MALEDLYKFERMTVADLITVMIKYLDFDSVQLTAHHRPDVASRIYYRIEIHKDEGKDATGHVEAQRMDLLQSRLIQWLDSKDLRPKNFIKPAENT